MYRGTLSHAKTCNEVLSMLYDSILRLKCEESTKFDHHLRITVDNCGGQNKNRWVLWFCDCLVCTGQFDAVTLSCLVPGHTQRMYVTEFLV